MPKDEYNQSFRDTDFDKSLYIDDEDIIYKLYDGEDALAVIIPIEYDEELQSDFSKADKQPVSEVKASEEKRDIISAIPSLISSIPSFIEHTGEITVNIFKKFIDTYGAYIALPFVLVFSALSKAFKRLIRMLAVVPKSFAEEVKGISYEIKIIRKQSKKMAKDGKAAYHKAMRKYFVISFTRHSLFWKTILNTVFPIVMASAVLFFFSQAEKKIFALQVVYNGIPVGYVENETVFEEAKNRALTLLGKDTQNKSYLETLSAEPEYNLKRISLSELDGKDTICENIITASDASLIRACGVYIDGEFICAVKNESDAASVFSSILAPQKKKAAEGTIVAFVEEIDYVQGLYPEESIWDSLKLKNTVTKPKSEAKYHKLKKKESASSVSKKYGITISKLKALNPGVDFSKLKKGTVLLVEAQQNYIRTKVMKTRVRTETVPFSTIKRETSTLLKGTTKISQNGRNGKYEITELVTYIDGKETYSTVVSKKQTVGVLDKIILVGTKTITYTPSYGGGYGGSYGSGSGGMVWPARGAYRVSSHYGYRSPSISGWGFHGGIDIVRAGGGSTGCPIVAAASGRVVTAISGYYGYGHTVVIDHGNGLRTRYAHMQAGSLMVRAGQYVYAGQQIGRLGGTGNVTGPHLHFEVLKYGTKVNPYPYIR